MQLYVINNVNEKVILDIKAPTRWELANKIGQEFFVENEQYTVNDVIAESSNSDTTGGAIIGGLLGLLGGGIGILIGGVAGGLIGGIRDNDEKEVIEKFNNSKI
jgi:hypothetical protein